MNVVGQDGKGELPAPRSATARQAGGDGQNKDSSGDGTGSGQRASKSVDKAAVKTGRKRARKIHVESEDDDNDVVITRIKSHESLRPGKQVCLMPSLTAPNFPSRPIPLIYMLAAKAVTSLQSNPIGSITIRCNAAQSQSEG